ncbi:peptide/nickel transport system ATP-binding protein [Antricoccus suffuscus]|uniref:Peptide/nickel transport system ATP-binding protein n=1 Tax=Antricoccus suffuscus TaxID=1629062 RepID=A0A2T1A694_9ACTN|nr:ABC transporter ATP-binding protein [Antricoccus suffuscus]PRZ44132.1 peptide/nickel transport system ATP-binding protein [Antricoccus suffuscus]
MPSNTTTATDVVTGAPVDIASDAAPLAVAGLTVSAATMQGRFPVIEDVSLTLRAGKITGLAGESGSGKTVTALATMRLLEARVLRVESGSVHVGATDILGLSTGALRRARGRDIAMIFQEPMTSLDPMFTVGSSISEVLRTHLGLSKAKAKTRAIELLDRVGIPDPARRYNAYPFEMSGGMLQRVLIAMAISCEPDVLIADEPTTALDVTVQAQIMRLLQSLAADGMAVLLVTHDMGVISEYTDFLNVMYAGQVIESGTTAQVLEDPRHPYTAGLLASVPSTRTRLARLSSIPGKVPMLHEMPAGCRFAPRCGFAKPECASPQVLAQVESGRSVRCVRSSDLELEGVE